MKIFAQRLRELRLQHGFTQKYMAEKLHIKQQSYSRYELATGEPSLAILTEIAVIFNVSTDYLVGLSEI
ncbi:MAG: helix-turn-helix domain-containing protein [Clostridia bacterium]|nr:helix-turn-helix domain-containing protein [Clostridia bacterium]MDE6211209.1 helix-turn-helix domain-containing protein [Clostridia bacterium]MDE6605468.1 helix-turn-helix domain-containing protein [Clostridia bacterium]MDE6869187.1 helix-turn-helix domain-containing protein [Clostridia bacterium]